MDSTSKYVCLSLLKVLTVMVETGKNGFKLVLDALDVVKVSEGGLPGRTKTNRTRQYRAGLDRAYISYYCYVRVLQHAARLGKW